MIWASMIVSLSAVAQSIKFTPASFPNVTLGGKNGNPSRTAVFTPANLARDTRLVGQAPAGITLKPANGIAQTQLGSLYVIVTVNEGSFQNLTAPKMIVLTYSGGGDSDHNFDNQAKEPATRW